jgi:hypothetical protein
MLECGVAAVDATISVSDHCNLAIGSNGFEVIAFFFPVMLGQSESPTQADQIGPVL